MHRWLEVLLFWKKASCCLSLMAKPSGARDFLQIEKLASNWSPWWIHRWLKTCLRLSKLVSVENETFAEMKRLLTTMSSIFLVAGVEEATNPATFILAKECSARFEQETFLNTKILANFKMQLNRSILRKEICSVVIISEIIYSKIAKVFDTGISCILETETLCALKLMWPGSRSFTRSRT